MFGSGYFGEMYFGQFEIEGFIRFIWPTKPPLLAYISPEVLAQMRLSNYQQIANIQTFSQKIDVVKRSISEILAASVLQRENVIDT